MPKMDAVSRRNCAITVQLPAATSCASLIASDTNAKTIAATKEPTATVYSIARDFILFQVNNPEPIVSKMSSGK